jgi:catabolite regulation protein CreA
MAGSLYTIKNCLCVVFDHEKLLWVSLIYKWLCNRKFKIEEGKDEEVQKCVCLVIFLDCLTIKQQIQEVMQLGSYSLVIYT